MDGFKKRLSESVQLRLSLALSLTIVLVAVAASAFVFVSALDEAHELQDDTLRQVAMLYDRQHMTLHYPEGPATVDVGGEAFRILVRSTSRGERIAVAQELRSPMTALSLQAERLAVCYLQVSARESLLPLCQGIERSRQLIDQLLSLAAAQAAVPRPQARIGVHAVYRRVLEDLLPLAEQKHLDIGVEGSADVQLLVNPMDLFTLIKNLVDNAIRYTPAGGTIDLCLAQTDTGVCLQVKDSGPGISVEEHDRVFDPFYRTLGSGETGSGLGLSIVRAIAERVGARVALGFTDETSRRGLCVSLWFPCTRG